MKDGKGADGKTTTGAVGRERDREGGRPHRAAELQGAADLGARASLPLSGGDARLRRKRACSSRERRAPARSNWCQADTGKLAVAAQGRRRTGARPRISTRSSSVDMGDDPAAAIAALASRQIHGLMFADPLQYDALKAMPHLAALSGRRRAETAVLRMQGHREAVRRSARAQGDEARAEPCADHGGGAARHRRGGTALALSPGAARLPSRSRRSARIVDGGEKAAGRGRLSERLRDHALCAERPAVDPGAGAGGGRAVEADRRDREAERHARRPVPGTSGPRCRSARPSGITGRSR